MCIPYAPNEAFSLATLSGVFYGAMRRLNGGDPRGVHFAYPHLERGHPRGLPAGFANLLDFGRHNPSREALDRLRAYVHEHAIGLVLGFDMEPVDPLARAARAGGAERVVAYSGAPLGTAVRPVRRLVKRALIAAGGEGRVDAIICESRAMERLAVVARGCPPGLLRVVPTGADIGRFRPPTDAEEARYVRDTFGIPEGRCVVIFSGHTHERKGVGVLLEAAVELVDRRGRRDVHIVLCGDRRTEAADWMTRLAGRAAAAHVQFGGYRTDMPQMMRGADVGVLPTSGWDAMTLSVHEMAASGLPIVTTTVGGLPEAVADGCTGIVCPPGNAGALADAIARLLDDATLRHRMGAAGRERAVGEFSLDAQEARLHDVLEGVMAAPRA